MILAWLPSIYLAIVPLSACTQFVLINSSTCNSACGLLTMVCSPNETFLLSTNILACFKAVLQIYPQSTLVSYGNYPSKSKGVGCQANINGEIVTVALFTNAYFCYAISANDQGWFNVCPCANASHQSLLPSDASASGKAPVSATWKVNKANCSLVSFLHPGDSLFNKTHSDCSKIACW